MNSHSSSSLIFIFILFFSLSLSSAQPNFRFSLCSPAGNYTAGSKYRSNLNSVLSSITSNTQIDYGFYNFTAGEGSDEVYSVALCRGDVSVSVCRNCLRDAAPKLLEVCPVQKEAIGWYNECMLRYSNQSIFGVHLPPMAGSCINEKDPDLVGFNLMLGGLLGELQYKAASGDSRRKFAAGDATVAANLTVYVMVECTPDLSSSDCSKCLGGEIYNISSYCNGSRGALIMTPICDLRYDIHKFYNSNYALPPSPLASTTTVPNTYPKKKKLKHAIVILVPTVISIVLISLIYCFFISRRNIWKKLEVNMDEIETAESNEIETAESNEIETAESLRFDLSLVKTATRNFSAENKLGEGGFGKVYQGKLENGQEVAVKRLSKKSGQGVREFNTEVVLVAKLQHKNLVKLLGFCLAAKEKILVYEFLPNASLDRFLFDPVKRATLDWETRFKIINGIAKGLLYLHEDSRLKIIHRDLKASNILLDEAMNPKISDFGLARLFGVDQTQDDTKRIAGTYGYMAPEYAIAGHFSVKSDVYSFGVLVLEIVSDQKNRFFGRAQDEEALLHRAWRLWNEGVVLQLVDEALDNKYSGEEITKCIHIGLLCIQEDPTKRLGMATVVTALNGQSISLPLPTSPHFFTMTTEDGSRELEHENAIQRSDFQVCAFTGTENITNMYPR